jgi:uncharacterized repeat protein (TIGR01451 family)
MRTSTQRTRLLPALAAAGFLWPLAPVLAQPAYTIEALDLLTGTDEAQVNGLNATGTVVGGTKATGSAFEAARWATGSTAATDLASLIGQAASVATAVNGPGQFTLQAIAPGFSLYSAHFWNGTTLTNLGSIPGASLPSAGPISISKGMNDSGQVVGYSVSSVVSYHGFSWQGGAMTELAGPPGCGSWEAYDVNSTGQIVGRGVNGTCGFDGQGLIWASASDSAVVLNDVLAGAGLPPRAVGIRFAFSINDAGTVLAQEAVASKPRCLLITANPVAVVDLGVLSSDPANAGCIPGAVNNLGEAVAYEQAAVSGNPDTKTALLWSGNTLYDLETLLDATAQTAWDLETAVAINDSGTVTGLGMFNGKLVGYCATRTAAPGGGITVTDSVDTVDDRQLAFGTVTIGVRTIGTVTMSNGTASTASISITESLAAPFGIADPDDCTIDLAPAASCTITLTYDPVAAVASSDTLTLDLDGVPAVVTVSGTGRTATTSLTDSMAPADDSTLAFAGSVVVGGTGTATVTIENTDLVPVAVRLSEGLAAPFAFQDAAACDLTVAADQSCTLTVVFSPTAAGAVSESFTVNAGGTSYTVTVTGAPGLPNANISVTQSAVPLVLQPGADTTTITVTVQNAGPDDAAVTVTDLLPTGLGFVGATSSADAYAAGTGLWDVGSLPNGPTATLQIQAQAALTASDGLANTATAAAVAPAVDPLLADNSSILTIGVPACVDLVVDTPLVEDFIDLAAGAGQRFVHSMQVTNRRPSTASGVVLTLDAYSVDIDESAFVVPPPAAGSTVPVGDLGPGESRRVTVATFTNPVDVYKTNVEYSVSVFGAEPEVTPGDNAYSAEFENRRRTSGANSSSGCFIATAAYGSYLEPEVMALRQFRDQVLLQGTWGRAFVAWYYRVSPPVAEMIRASEALRFAARALLTPVVYAVKYPAPAGGFLLALCAGPWILRRRRRSAAASGDG